LFPAVNDYSTESTNMETFGHWHWNSFAWVHKMLFRLNLFPLIIVVFVSTFTFVTPWWFGFLTIDLKLAS
jgi:hypothetical protein